ncbi:MAG TPA: hypothetical protein VL442_14580 [Mucilaginibacter sp.]|nr:hypothetical protein [Mucilaginibacter sp.]
MRKSIYIIAILSCWLGGVQHCLAQNEFSHFKMDSLSKLLTLKKTIRDSILILQQMVDVTPIHQNELKNYPDETKPLLELNSRVKLIDPEPYRLIQEGNNYWTKKQYRESLKCLQRAVDIFDKQHKIIIPLLMNMRILYNLLDDQDARLQYYTQKLNYYLVNGPEENAAPCYHGIGYIYYIKGAWNQSISFYLQGAAIFRHYDPHYYVNAIAVIGTSYMQWGNVKKANQYLNNILPIAQRINDLNGLSAIYYGLAFIADQQKKYNEALVFIDKDRANQLIVSQRTATSIAFKAHIYLDMGQPDSALPLLKRAKALADSGSYKIVNNFGDMEVAYDYYRYYKLAGDYKKAEESLLAALKQVTEEKGVRVELKYLRELGDFYAQQHKPGLSEKYLKQCFEISDISEKNLDEFKVAQYEIDQNDKEQREHISQLKQEKAVQNYQLSRRNMLLVVSFAVILLVIFLLAFIYKQLVVNKKTLISLRQTQRQLVQSEKMASLGELTAGIAHEIQNPLNFVNNFSDVSTELMGEMTVELEKGDLDEVKAIASDVTQNLEKIRHHGKRADAIVKGMLEHSRSSTGKKEPTNLNTLADEYLRLAYHGLRAKDKEFNAELVTCFDDKLPNLDVIPQDIGRVLLNLFNNAFYAVNQKAKTAGPDYKPIVEVSTARENSSILIKVKTMVMGSRRLLKTRLCNRFSRPNLQEKEQD